MGWWKTHVGLPRSLIYTSNWLLFPIPHHLWTRLVNSYNSLLTAGYVSAFSGGRKGSTSSVCHEVQGKFAAQFNILWWTVWITFNIGKARTCIHFFFLEKWGCSNYGKLDIVCTCLMYGKYILPFGSYWDFHSVVIAQNCSGFFVFKTPASASAYLLPDCNLIKISMCHAIVFWTVNSILNVSGWIVSR